MSLAALMLNTMIGASIFGLPSLIAARLGRLSPIAYFIAFAGVAVIAACLAEVASYFRRRAGRIFTRERRSGDLWAFRSDGLRGCRAFLLARGVANLSLLI